MWHHVLCAFLGESKFLKRELGCVVYSKEHLTGAPLLFNSRCSAVLRTYYKIIWITGLLILFIFFKFYLFIYLWLCWVFVSERGLPPVAASGGHSSSRCAGLSLSRPLLLGSTGSRRAGSVIVAHGPSCSVACGIFPDQGSNPCPLHCQADSQPLAPPGKPLSFFLIVTNLQKNF